MPASYSWYVGASDLEQLFSSRTSFVGTLFCRVSLVTSHPRNPIWPNKGSSYIFWLGIHHEFLCLEIMYSHFIMQWPELSQYMNFPSYRLLLRVEKHLRWLAAFLASTISSRNTIMPYGAFPSLWTWYHITKPDNFCWSTSNAMFSRNLMVPAFGAGWLFVAGHTQKTRLAPITTTNIIWERFKTLGWIYWLLHDIKKYQKKLGSITHPPKKYREFITRDPTSTGAHLGWGSHLGWC